MICSVDLSAMNPWRPVDWRWQRAQRITNGEIRSRRTEDDATRLACQFLRALRKAGDNEIAHDTLARRHAGLYWANRLYGTEDVALRAEVEARVLAGCSDAEIARRSALPELTVQYYVQFFFDVRSRLQQPSYILHTVLGQSLHRGMNERDYPLLWKFYGYQYGPLMLDSLIGQHLPTPRPRTVAEVKACWKDDGIASILRKQALAARLVPVNTFTQVDILTVYSKFVEIDRNAAGGGGSGGSESTAAVVAGILSSLSIDVGLLAHDHVQSETIRHVDSSAVELSTRQLLEFTRDPDQTTDEPELLFLPYPDPANHAHIETSDADSPPDSVG